MNKGRPILVLTLLICAMLISFVLPKAEYKSPDIMSRLDIPLRLANWQGEDISGQLNLDDMRYNFINKVFAREYKKPNGENLMFIILDAGNFHNPKVCFQSSGYKIKDLTETQFNVKGRAIRAHTVYFERDAEGLLVIYWMCINKKIVDWNQQKIIQLWYSLFNKEKTGLMARLDIPASGSSLDRCVSLAKEFISDVSSAMPQEQLEYLFGLK